MLAQTWPGAASGADVLQQQFVRELQTSGCLSCCSTVRNWKLDQKHARQHGQDHGSVAESCGTCLESSWILVFSSKNTFPRLPKSSLQCDIPAYAAWAVPASLSLSRKVILRKAWGEAVPEQRAGWQQHGTGTKTTVTCSLRSPGKA